MFYFSFDSGIEGSSADNNTGKNTCQLVLDSMMYNDIVQIEGTTEHFVDVVISLNKPYVNSFLNILLQVYQVKKIVRVCKGRVGPLHISV